MNKHTPGPWTLEADASHFDSMTTVVGGERLNAKPHSWPGRELVVQVGGTSSLRTMEANARLIASAPDLLHALQVFLSDYSALKSPLAGDMQMHLAMQTARAAIAKVENKQ